MNGGPALTFFYEHTALAGLGYRMDRHNGFHLSVDDRVQLLLLP